jgi:hypothetical protein
MMLGSGQGNHANHPRPLEHNMAKSTATANWTQIDTDSLPPAIYNAYSEYKAAYADMKVQRKAFEDELTAILNVPQGKRAVFGYNFGKLSIAIVDDDKPAAKASSAVSLASLIRR